MKTVKRPLTLSLLKQETRAYFTVNANQSIKYLYGVNDGKAIGTYIEHAFRDYLSEKYAYVLGNSASGIDFPSLGVDMKVTSIRQPQSSCPYKDAAQKVYGLGHHLLVFVYEKMDDHKTKTAKMKFLHGIFVDSSRTADFQTTQGLNDIIARGGNRDDIAAFLEERNLPLDEIGRINLARRIISEKLKIGYLTMSNALQWRLQYGRVIELSKAGETNGIENIL